MLACLLFTTFIISNVRGGPFVQAPNLPIGNDSSINEPLKDRTKGTKRYEPSSMDPDSLGGWEPIPPTPIATSSPAPKRLVEERIPAPAPAPSPSPRNNKDGPTESPRGNPAPSPPNILSAIEIVAKKHLANIQPQCGAELGTFWYYGDLPFDWIDVETASECCDRCDDEPLCHKWSFGLAGLYYQRCYLKAGGSYSDARESFISGYSTQRGIRPEDGEL